MNQTEMDYKEFVEALSQQLREMLAAEVKLEIRPVLKNNSRHLDGLLLYSPNMGNTMPNFYLQDYYARYQDGAQLAVLAEDICNSFLQFQRNPLLSPRMDYDYCQHWIVYRLINAGRNREFLEGCPHIPLFDLAVVFYYLVSREKDGIGSIRVSNEIMASWGINTQTLMRQAQENTPRLFPAKCQPLRSVLDALIFQTGVSGDVEPLHPTWETYILTNSNQINGASVWLYPGLLADLADAYGSSFFILPSSIHELLAVPEGMNMEPDEMLDMVRQVNRQCVEQDEFLSDNIYYYDHNMARIRIFSERSDKKRKNFKGSDKKRENFEKTGRKVQPKSKGHAI